MLTLVQLSNSEYSLKDREDFSGQKKTKTQKQKQMFNEKETQPGQGRDKSGILGIGGRDTLPYLLPQDAKQPPWFDRSRSYVDFR